MSAPRLPEKDLFVLSVGSLSGTWQCGTAALLFFFPLLGTGDRALRFSRSCFLDVVEREKRPVGRQARRPALQEGGDWVEGNLLNFHLPCPGSQSGLSLSLSYSNQLKISHPPGGGGGIIVKKARGSGMIEEKAD